MCTSESTKNKKKRERERETPLRNVHVDQQLERERKKRRRRVQSLFGDVGRAEAADSVNWPIMFSFLCARHHQFMALFSLCLPTLTTDATGSRYIRHSVPDANEAANDTSRVSLTVAAVCEQLRATKNPL